MKRTIYAVMLLSLGLLSCKKKEIAPTNSASLNQPLSAASIGQSVISVTMSEQTDIINDGYGYNTRFPEVFNPYTSNGSFWTKAVDSSRANIIRFPGGTVGNFWAGDASILFSRKSTADPKGWIDASKISSTLITDAIIANNQKKNSLADLEHVVSTTNCSVSFVLNMITPGEDFYASPEGWNRAVHSHPPSTTNYTTPLTDDWYKMLDNRYARTKHILLHAKANNIPIKYIELGNECYLALSSYYTDAFPQGEDYAIAANYFLNKLKNDPDLNLGPNVKFAVPGVAERSSFSNPRINNWNSRMLSRLDPSIHNMVLHSYEDANMALTSFTSASDLYGNISKWIDNMNNALTIHGTQPLLQSGSGWHMWWNELSPQQAAGIKKKWGAVLTQVFAALWSIDHNGVNYMKPNLDADDIIDPATGSLNQQGCALLPLMRATNNCNKASHLHFSGLPKIGNTERTIVQGYYFTNNDSDHKCCIVNFSDQAINVDLSTVFPHHSQLTISGHTNDINSNKVPVNIGTHTSSTTYIVLQPYSVNFVRP